MGRLAAAVLAAAGLLIPAAQAAAAGAHHDMSCHARRQTDAAIVVLHAGGWSFGSAADLEPVCRAYARAGFDGVSLEYPLGDVVAAQRYADSAVRRLRRTHRRVYAAGWSAGGTIAAELAAEGLVDAAFSVGGPMDLRHYQLPGPRVDWFESLHLHAPGIARVSPLETWGHKSTSLLIQQSVQDDLVPFSQATRMQARCSCRLVRLQGAHLRQPYTEVTGLGWIEQRDRRFTTHGKGRLVMASGVSLRF